MRVAEEPSRGHWHYDYERPRQAYSNVIGHSLDATNKHLNRHKKEPEVYIFCEYTVSLKK